MKYDIRNHEFADEDIICSPAGNKNLIIESPKKAKYIILLKGDAIAIARHFKLTTNDLGEE